MNVDLNTMEDGFLAVLSLAEIENKLKESLTVTDSIFTVKNGEQLSIEALTDSANATWTRTQASFESTVKNLKKYHEVIYAGINRLYEEINMLSNITDDMKTKKPYKDEITISKLNRFTVNGKLEPSNVRPLMVEFQNLINFGDKILSRYGDVVFDLLTSVNFDEKFLSEFEVDLSAFSSKAWLHGSIEVDTIRDKRFKEKQTVNKGSTFNSNRAIYYVGPPDDISKGFESPRHKWTLTKSTLTSLRFKCLNDSQVRFLEDKATPVKVSNLMSVKQRCGILSGMLKRLIAKKRDVNKQLDNIDRVLTACIDIKNKADNVKEVKSEEEPQSSPFPSENKVFIEAMALYRNNVRLTFDYYNAVSIFLRLMGSQAALCDKEIKAYSEPMTNPQNQPENKT